MRSQTYTCDRCGRTDAGETGWGRVVTDDGRALDLCPDCYRQYMAMLTDFLDGGNGVVTYTIKDLTPTVTATSEPKETVQTRLDDPAMGWNRRAEPEQDIVIDNIEGRRPPARLRDDLTEEDIEKVISKDPLEEELRACRAAIGDELTEELLRRRVGE